MSAAAFPELPLPEWFFDDEHSEHPSEEVVDEEVQRRAERLARPIAWGIAAEFARKLCDYLVAGGRANVEGAGIRAFVAAWFFDERLGRLKQPQLATLMRRRHKQSVGKEVSRFRTMFPDVAKRGLQSEAAREACRDREARKAAQRLEVGFAQERGFEVVIDFQI